MVDGAQWKGSEDAYPLVQQSIRFPRITTLSALSSANFANRVTAAFLASGLLRGLPLQPCRCGMQRPLIVSGGSGYHDIIPPS